VAAKGRACPGGGNGKRVCPWRERVRFLQCGTQLSECRLHSTSTPMIPPMAARDGANGQVLRGARPARQAHSAAGKKRGGADGTRAADRPEAQGNEGERQRGDESHSIIEPSGSDWCCVAHTRPPSSFFLPSSPGDWRICDRRAGLPSPVTRAALDSPHLQWSASAPI